MHNTAIHWTIFALLIINNVEQSQGMKSAHDTIELDWFTHSKYETDFSSSLLFHLKPSQNIAFMLSCVEVKINSSIGDFEMIYADSDSFVSEGNWYQTASDTLMKISRWFSGISATDSGALKGNCFSPYKDLYILVKPYINDQAFQVQTKLIYFDLHCCFCLISGLVLFYFAEKLAKSETFYYTSGTSVGVLASVLLMVFVLSRLFPKKKVAYTLLFGGWSICAWILSKLWNNLSEMLVHHYYLVAFYILVSGFLSFVLLYRYGPVIEPRSYNIIQWCIQFLSILLIYNGTQLHKVSLTILFGILLHEMLTNSKTRDHYDEFIRFIRTFKPVRKIIGSYGVPKPRRLLTDDEYTKQGELETKKALEELRKFCQSPNCSPWKTLSRIETPKRFARFIEGEGHLSDREVSCYDNDVDLTGDEEREEEEFMSEDEGESFKLDLNDLSSDDD